MKKTFGILIIAAFFFSNCKPTENTGSNTGNTATERFNRPANSGAQNDSITVTGTQYIPMYGKSEAGVRPDLEGTWVLESLEGYTVKGDARQKLESLAQSKNAAANRNDTIRSTTTKNGVTRTTTEINIDRNNEQPKITPPQGSNYHIPERPSISFFGSNETFSGFTGCNKYSGRYVQEDSTSLTLKTANPSTKMVCLGDWDEETYLNALRRVNKFKGTESTLELMEGDKTIITFRRKAD